MEICSQKKTTFSLTVWYVYGELSIEVVIWNMDMQGHPQIQISRI